MNKRKNTNSIKLRRKKRTRANFSGTAKRPRISVFRSSKNIFIQLIDDSVGKTLISASSIELSKTEKKKKKIEQARIVSEKLLERAKKEKIKEAVFDRGHYSYHGRVKEVAEQLRKEIKL